MIIMLKGTIVGWFGDMVRWAELSVDAGSVIVSGARTAVSGIG